MAQSPKNGKSKEKKGAMADPAATPPVDRIDTPSRLNLDRQEIARMTEQKIDEIESAIKQDYLKHTKAAKEAAVLEQPSVLRREAYNKNGDPMQVNTHFPDSVPLQSNDEDFQPTLIRTDNKFSLFNDDSDL